MGELTDRVMETNESTIWRRRARELRVALDDYGALQELEAFLHGAMSNPEYASEEDLRAAVPEAAAARIHHIQAAHLAAKHGWEHPVVVAELDRWRARMNIARTHFLNWAKQHFD